jgi:hypothetical protein
VKPHSIGSVGAVAQVHEQVSSLLRCPRPARMGGDTQDVDPAGGHVHTNSTYNRRSITVSMWKKSAASSPDA